MCECKICIRGREARRVSVENPVAASFIEGILNELYAVEMERDVLKAKKQGCWHNIVNKC